MALKKYQKANVFDVNTAQVVNGYFLPSGAFTPYATNAMVFIPIQQGKVYDIYGIVRVSSSTAIKYGTFANIPSTTETDSIRYGSFAQSETLTITADTNENYIAVMFCGDGDYSAYGSVQNALNINCANMKVDTLQWQDIPYRRYETATDTIQSGDTIYANGQPITTYSIKGNTVQSGTPTPSNPVDVNGVGEHTINMCNVSYDTVYNQGTSSEYQYTINSDKTITIPEDKAMYSGFKIKVSPSTTYTIHCAASSNGQMRLREYSAPITDWTTNYIKQSVNVTIKQPGEGYGTVSFTTTAETEWVIFHWYIDPSFSPCTLSEIMMVQGNYDRYTLPTYEPYGFKIPISSGGTTTLVYLSEPLMKISDSVDSKSNTTETRNIVRQRITQASSVNQFSHGFTVDVPIAAKYQAIYSNVAVSTDALPAVTERDGKVWINAAKEFIGFGASEDFPIAGSDNPTPAEINVFNNYLQNNEVYVWYVLATPTTETVTAPTIPTTDGANSITVDTTVQPSEFTATWTGWHNAEVKEKSENLFDVDEIGNIYPNPETQTIRTGIVIEGLTPSSTYYFQITNPNAIDIFYARFNGNERLDTSSLNLTSSGTIEMTSTANAIRFWVSTDASWSTISNIMLVEGSTAPSQYEPYWK